MPNGAKQGQIGPDRVKQPQKKVKWDQIGSNLPNGSKAGSNGVEQGQTELNGAKRTQKEPIGAKRSQTWPNK